MKAISHYLCLMFLLFCFTNNESSAQINLNVRDAVTGLDTPWEILWGPDNYIWVTERYGRISRANPETGEIIPLITIEDVFESGERGLMGLVLHPDFDNTPHVFTVYNTGYDNSSTRIKIVRYTYQNDKLVDPYILKDDIFGWSNHDGARLWIDDDLTMFVTIGDRAQSQTAQDLSSMNGKILRMNLDGTVPGDNPFEGSLVWSYGHRNPQGLVRANGILYSAEHGPAYNDELNIIEKGRNYGWFNVSGYCDDDERVEKQFCQENNVVEPILSWYPKGVGSTIAVCGIDYYDHELIPEWRNSILAVALKASMLVHVELDDSRREVVTETHYFRNQFGRLRDLCIAPDGRVFIATSNRDGRGSPRQGDDKIIELTPKINSINTSTDKDSGFNAYPNPFSQFSIINYQLSIPSDVVVKVYDMLSNEVAELVDGFMDASSHSTVFEAGNLPSGLYYYTIRIGGNVESGKVMLIR